MNILKKYKKILHIKIPKNGTHSINKVIKDKDNWNRSYFFEHDPLCVIEENNFIDKDVFVFCFSRNPFTRFYSLYNQFKKHFYLIGDVGYDKNIFNFVNDIKSNIVHPFFCSPQTEWIADFEQNFLTQKIDFKTKINPIGLNLVSPIKNKKIKNISKVYKIENVKLFEKDFNVKLNYYNYSIYSLNEYISSFDIKIKNFILHYYEEDFINFNYSFDFEQSIIELKNQRKNLLLYQ